LALLLDARDERIRQIDISGIFYDIDPANGERTQRCRNRWILDGYLAYHWVAHPSGQVEEYSWDGSTQWIVGTPPNPGAPRTVRKLDQRLSDMTTGGMPFEFGIRSSDVPYGDLIRDAALWEVEPSTTVLAGRECAAISVTLTDPPGRWYRAYFDLDESLLAIRHELLVKVDDVSLSPQSEPAVIIGGLPFAVLFRWDVTDVFCVDGVYLPKSGVFTDFGAPSGRAHAQQVAIEVFAENTKVGPGAAEGAPFCPKLRTGDQIVRTVGGGIEVETYGAQNSDGVRAGRLDAILEETAEKVGTRVSGAVDPDSDEWLELGCGHIALYLFLRLQGFAVDIHDIKSSLEASPENGLSVRAIRDYCRRFLSGIEVYKSNDLEHLATSRRYAIALLQNVSSHRNHYVLMKGLGNGVLVTDPSNGPTEITLDELELPPASPEGTFLLVGQFSRPFPGIPVILFLALIALIGLASVAVGRSHRRRVADRTATVSRQLRDERGTSGCHQPMGEHR